MPIYKQTKKTENHIPRLLPSFSISIELSIKTSSPGAIVILSINPANLLQFAHPTVPPKPSKLPVSHQSHLCATICTANCLLLLIEGPIGLPGQIWPTSHRCSPLYEPISTHFGKPLLAANQAKDPRTEKKSTLNSLFVLSIYLNHPRCSSPLVHCLWYAELWVGVEQKENLQLQVLCMYCRLLYFILSFSGAIQTFLYCGRNRLDLCAKLLFNPVEVEPVIVSDKVNCKTQMSKAS